MSAIIYGVLAAGGTILMLVIGYLIKGVIAYFGKKGAEHVYENREEYKKKWRNRNE